MVDVNNVILTSSHKMWLTVSAYNKDSHQAISLGNLFTVSVYSTCRLPRPYLVVQKAKAET